MTAPAARMYAGDRFARWLGEPQHTLRIEIVRVLAPLAVLGFMAPRIAHADEWIGRAGFHVPDLGVSDARQPLYVPPLPDELAWVVAGALVVAAIALSVGLKTRFAAIAFTLLTAFVALSDRLAAFSVSKLAPVVGFVLAVSACGAHASLDALFARRKRKKKKRKRAAPAPSGSVRFFQLLLPTIYCASGIAKARGDWLKNGHVLWTHIHDTYQTSFTVVFANLVPAPGWTLLQVLTLLFETFAPIWFAWRRARVPALVWAVSMHGMIGLMFGPVRWFALLMISLLLGAYLPDRALERLAARLSPR